MFSKSQMLNLNIGVTGPMFSFMPQKMFAAHMFKL